MFLIVMNRQRRQGSVKPCMCMTRVVEKVSRAHELSNALVCTGFAWVIGLTGKGHMYRLSGLGSDDLE